MSVSTGGGINSGSYTQMPEDAALAKQVLVRLTAMERDLHRVVQAVDRIEAQGEKLRRWMKLAQMALRHIKWD